MRKCKVSIITDCDPGTYGLNCDTNCSCHVQNTQSCDKVTGSCTCKTGWEGTNCSSDVNECLNKTICPSNSQCSNSDGTYSCVCSSGYLLVGDQCIGKCKHLQKNN